MDSAENKKRFTEEQKQKIEILLAVYMMKILTPSVIRAYGGRMSKKRWEMLEKF